MHISDGPAPKHEQLRRILENMCDTELSPGDLLPGERALEEAYGVSRITVRRAIGDLVAAGRLRRIRGKGTYVAPSPLISHLQLASFSDEMRAQRVTASSKILLSGWSVPPREVAEFFGTHDVDESGTDSPVPHIHLRRLRRGDGEPYAIDDAWYNATLVPDLLEHDVYNSVYTLLEHNYGLGITTADQTVTAVQASETNASLLDVPAGAALLHILRYARSGDHNVELCSSLYRTDRYRLTTRVERSQP
ncbi:HTH-type transcriptional repressor DasR [Corynebacterium capitovis DSM 44611]|uniref:GntR family transcriptional regulator n=1 Tax=Corynebacterium capitovis TaxID=131081 RepID=UPI000362F1D4|nr:GntR family transcriptional regulator [Corynebacterium capitovis]WKD58297.1 HTH-type transcriptional repressor DasR [Corynebacterium capitovis DSM 44611]